MVQNKNTLDWKTTWQITEALRSLELPVKDKSVLGMPVFLVDPQTNPLKAIGTDNPLKVNITGTVGTEKTVVLQGYLNVLQGVLKYSSLTAESIRVPEIYKHVTATTAAATAVWTPAAGKKFRIIGGVIVASGALAAAATQEINLLDNATDIGLNFSSYFPAAASILGVGTVIPFDLRPNGYLSAAINQVLNVTMTANCTAGGVSVTVYGTEE